MSVDYTNLPDSWIESITNPDFDENITIDEVCHEGFEPVDDNEDNVVYRRRGEKIVYDSERQQIQAYKNFRGPGTWRVGVENCLK